jgi:hypothetical protein
MAPPPDEKRTRPHPLVVNFFMLLLVGSFIMIAVVFRLAIDWIGGFF